MNELTQKLIFTLVIVPILLGIFRTPKEMGIAAAAISVALAFANLDRIESFSAVFFQAKLRSAVEKAYAAIDQLKELGVALSEPIVDEMAVSGRMLQYIHLKYKLERVAKIEETLQKLGASPDEIETACSVIYVRVTQDHVRHILYALKAANPGKETLFDGLDGGKMDQWDEQRVEKLVKDNALQKNHAVEEAILDLQYFLKNKKLRREEEWQS